MIPPKERKEVTLTLHGAGQQLLHALNETLHALGDSAQLLQLSVDKAVPLPDGDTHFMLRARMSVEVYRSGVLTHIGPSNATPTARAS